MIKSSENKTNLKLYIVSIILCVFAVILNNLRIDYETLNNNFIIRFYNYFEYNKYFIDYLLSLLCFLPMIALLIIVIFSKNKKPLLLAIPAIIYLLAIVVFIIYLKVTFNESFLQYLQYEWADLVIYLIFTIMIIVTFAIKNFTKLPLIIYCFLMVAVGAVLLAAATMPYGMTVINTEGKVIKIFNISYYFRDAFFAVVVALAAFMQRNDDKKEKIVETNEVAE